MNNQLLKSVVVGVIINIALPFALKPFATESQIKPPTGANNLPFLDQIMHMFVHHAQVPITSSLIIAIIVGLSVFISKL
tara:strand:+ start:1517 stop:1753 length:237 start_codon:yes stop_codon:yes gene_type:complete